MHRGCYDIRARCWDATVLLVPYNDVPGQAWTDEVGHGLTAAGVKRLKVLEQAKAWDKAFEKADISDWIAAGLTETKFWEAADKALQMWARRTPTVCARSMA
jgi:hypothetical protein